MDIKLNEISKNYLRPYMSQVCDTLSSTAMKRRSIRHIVTFMTDSVIYKQAYIKEGKRVAIPTPPTKEGYTFKNWLLNGEAFDFSTVITSDILLIAEFEETESGIYTWNGVASDDDITVIQPGDPGMPVTFHKVSNDKYTRSDIVNQTVKITCIDNDDNITVLSGNNIAPSSDDPSYTFIMLPLPLLLFSGEADIGPMLELEEEIYLNGTYMISTTNFDSAEPFTTYCKELRIEEPEVIYEADMEFTLSGDYYGTEVHAAFPAFSQINTDDYYTLSINDTSFTGKFVFEEEDDDTSRYGLANFDDDGGLLQIFANNSYYAVISFVVSEPGTYTVKLAKFEAPAPSAE